MRRAITTTAITIDTPKITQLQIVRLRADSGCRSIRWTASAPVMMPGIARTLHHDKTARLLQTSAMIALVMLAGRCGTPGGPYPGGCPWPGPGP